MSSATLPPDLAPRFPLFLASYFAVIGKPIGGDFAAKVTLFVWPGDTADVNTEIKKYSDLSLEQKMILDQPFKLTDKGESSVRFSIPLSLSTRKDGTVVNKPWSESTYPSVKHISIRETNFDCDMTIAEKGSNQIKTLLTDIEAIVNKAFPNLIKSGRTPSIAPQAIELAPPKGL
jgi:hypothetical protein